MHQIIIDIYEYAQVGPNEFEWDKYPIVTHIFRGETQEEAWDYFHAHLKSDKFLYAAYYDGDWHGVPLRYVMKAKK